jgi:hypothetical protein
VRTTESFCDRATGVKIKGNGGEFIYALRFDKAFMSAVEKLLRNKERVEEMQLANLARQYNRKLRSVDKKKLYKKYKVKVKKTVLLNHLYIYTCFYQDRLGTNIRKTF